MQAERDHLVRFVFPKLRQELLQRRIHLVDVDLRWGVTSDQDASEVCREVVDECHPRFLCMLGGRYGSVPAGKQHSITADEIHYGVLDREATQRGFSHFYFREERATIAMEETTRGEFREPKGSDSQKALTKLKQAIVDAGLNPFTYPAQWDKQSLRLIGLAEFGQQVHDDLLRSMKDDPELRDRFTESTEKLDEFAEENAAMEAFIEERTQRFVLGSRKVVMDELLAHASSTGGNGYLCLIGAPGSGKSALLSKFSRSFSDSSLITQSSSLLINHFVGASAGSTDVRRTLRRLCHELIDGTGITAEIPEDPEKLRAVFPEILKQASEKKHIVVLLDAVNQFDSTTQLAGLMWLPEELPENVRIILSAMSEVSGQQSADGIPSSAVSPLNALRHRRVPPKEIELKPLTLLSSARIVRAFLHRYRKQMDRKQQRALLSKTDAVTPLYLLSALEELRTLGTYEEITDRIAQLPSETQKLFTWILKRLENDDGFRDEDGRKIGSELVSKFASLMGVSRHGLSQQELVELLSPGDSQGNVAALIQLLRPYLMQRGELLDFYHGQFREAVTTAYLPAESQRLAAHDQLATYFRDKADPEKNQSWKGDSPRPLSELPFHLIQAENWTVLIGNADKPGVLTDLRFIEAKCTVGLAHDLVANYNATVTALPEFREERERLRVRDEAMLAYNRALKDYAVIRYEWLQAKKLGETTPEPIYPPLPLELKAEPEAEIPENHSERSARLRHFFNFVNAQLSSLISTPHDTLPLAYNLAKDGPVFDDAEKGIALRTEPWLRRSPRPPVIPFRPQCLRTLEGHSLGISSVSMSPDGRHAVSGSGDHTVRVWDLNTGACLRTLEGHNSRVSSVRVSPDGRRIISNSENNTVRVWDLGTGTCLRILEGHNEWVSSVSVSPDGRRAISGSKDNTVRVWDLNTGACLRTLEGHNAEVSDVSVCPDGRRAISGGGFGDNTLRVWDLDTGACLRTLTCGIAGVNSVSVSPDGRRVISGGCAGDSTVRVWDLDTGACLRTLTCGIAGVNSVSVSPDGRRVISGSGDKIVRVWDIETGACLRTLEGHNAGVSDVSVSPDGRRAISGGDNIVCVWNLDAGTNQRTSAVHSHGVNSVSVSPDGRHAISSGGWDNILRVWDMKTGSCLHTLENNKEGVYSVGVSPDGRRAISGGGFGDNTLRVWDLDTGACLRTLEGHSSEVSSVSVSPDGRRAISGSRDNTVRVWDLDTGACLHILEGHSEWVSIVNVHPDGRRVISGGDNTARVWDMDTGVCLYILEGHNGGGYKVSVSPDGRRVISNSENNTVRVWDLDAGTCLRILEGHNEWVSSVSVSPDGRKAISGSWDNTVRVWDLDTGDCLRTFEGHSAMVSNISVSVSSDGRWVISGGDNTVRVWDLDAGACIAIYNLRSSFTPLAFSPSTGRIVCGALNGQMHFLTPVNFPHSGPAILTAIRPRHACCPVCGKQFVLRPSVVAAIQDQSTAPVQQSSLSIKHPAILSSCPKCQHPLQFNPFFSVTKDFADVFHRSVYSKTVRIKKIVGLFVCLILIAGGVFMSRLWPLAWLFGVPIMLVGLSILAINVSGMLQLGACPRCGGVAPIWKKKTVHCKKCGSFKIS